MLRYFRSGVPEPKIPQRFFGGMGSNKPFDSAQGKQLHLCEAPQIYILNFFPEGRFMIFAGRVLPCCKNHETFSFFLRAFASSREIPSPISVNQRRSVVKSFFSSCVAAPDLP